MYNECNTVLDVTEPILRRAIRGMASQGVQEVNVLSIESLTSFFRDVLGVVKARRTSAKDAGSIRSGLQAGYLLKKFKYGGNPVERERVAIKGFYARNSALEKQPHTWAKDNLQRQMRKCLTNALPLVSSWEPRFGKGAVAEKMPWIFRWECIATHPYCHQGSLIPVSYGLSLYGGDSVRLAAVPKDYAKDRLITVEPWLNTWVQHAVRRLLYESIHAGPLRGTAMDVLHLGKGAAEMLQQKLAVEGSKNGRYATLDLSDASDTISLADVEAVFPPWVLAWLLTCRTPTVETGKKSYEQLHMYAGMGNATTFVVQTLYFWAAAVACAKLNGLRGHFASVYGDDIVVDSRLCQLLLKDQVFETLGLKLNADKSYWGDCSFRESCGTWALNGQVITPTRFTGFDLESLRGRIGFADVVRRMVGSGCGMQLLLADRLVKKAGERVKVIPEDAPGSEFVSDKHGLWYARHTDGLVRRWNKDIHQYEIKAEMPAPRTVDIPTDRVGYLYGALSGNVTSTAMHNEKGEILGHFIAIPVPGDERTKKRWVPLHDQVALPDIVFKLWREKRTRQRDESTAEGLGNLAHAPIHG